MKRYRVWAMILSMVLLLTGCGAEKQAEAPDDNYRTYYEVFVRSYYDGDGDGIGDFKGLTEKLDYITELGFNGIWLMPIMPSPTYHKYDVTDYYAIDPQYGTMEDFKSFLAACEERGIRVIIDMVFNHTSSEHPWFKEAYQYLQGLEAGQEPDVNACPYVEYYNFQREFTTGYSVVEGTEWYYESRFWYGMPDLNLQNAAVRAELEEIAKYWLDMGVSGFRLDAAKEYETGNAEANIEILKWYTDFVKDYKPEAYLVAEVWDTLEAVTAYYASGIDSIFNYPFGNHDGKVVLTIKSAGGGKTGAAFAQALEEIENGFKAQNPNMIDAPFLSNHDTGHIAGFLAPSEDKIKLGGAVNLLMSGSSFVYYGEEIGMKGAGKDENKRAPMQWTTADGEGMTNPPPNMDKVQQKYGTVEEQINDADSIYSYYKNAIALRNTYPEIARGSQKAVTLSDGDIIVIAKEYEGETAYVVINNSEDEKQIDLKGTALEDTKLKSTLVVNPSVQAESITLKKNQLSMPGLGICILK